MKVTIFAIFILAGMLFAYPAELAKFTEAGMQADAMQLKTAQDAYLATIEGKERIMLVDGKVVEDEAQIQKLLEEHIVASSGFDENLASSNAEYEKLKEEISKAHSKCAQYTGLDNHECNDRESCIVAAFSVPQAASMVNADGFWETMKEWKGLWQDTSAQITATSDAFSATEKETSTAAKIGEEMKKLQKLAVEHNTHRIALNRTDEQCLVPGAVCYEYCPKINYEFGAWEAQAQKWNDVQNTLSEIGGAKERSAQIAANTKEWVEFTKNKAKMWTDAKNNLNSLDGKISSALSGKFSDSSLNAKYGEFGQKKDEAIALANEGKFYAALQINDEISAQGDEIIAAAKKHEENIASIEKMLEEMQLPVEKVADSEISAKYDAIKLRAKEPVEASKIEGLLTDAKALEQEVLAMVAKKTMSGELSADELAADVAKGKLAQAAEGSDITAAAVCPLPTMAFGILAGIAAFARRKK
ncbi:hypothetical protein COU37_00145 [Candidatus Micrarchaeota archaeon CG10_big_fil_rev_8_21_14_0_10_45_29]|nr:MAG: hypothetical protein COU37_00145 [Candidatus Micrarchaeota archaeon CG10_big_fil_rev_8_21_14_0_10_45_29]